ncbi:MAG: dehydrogenase [Pseudomonadota bacterium]
MTDDSFMGLRFVGQAEMDELLDFASLVEALEEAHKTPIAEVGRIVQEQVAEPGPNHFLSLPAWDPGRHLGIKLVTSFPGNEARPEGLPTVQALYVLFEGTCGRPVAILDGTALTPWKTAADSALGVKLLAPSEPESLLMVGAGVMADALIRAHKAVRPSLVKVRIWNRTAAKASALAESLMLDGVEIAQTDDLEAAVREADVISCATGSRAPLIEGDWLRPGQHIDLVGGFMPEMREVDDGVCKRARLFVDTRRFTVEECGDLMAPLASGAITEADVLGNLFELCQSKVVGRTADQDITLMKNGGGAHLDLMTAQHIAARLGIG